MTADLIFKLLCEFVGRELFSFLQNQALTPSVPDSDLNLVILRSLPLAERYSDTNAFREGREQLAAISIAFARL